MKKIIKGLICAGLCGAFAVSAAGCSGPSAHRDPEKDALKLAIGACDEKFNPLFYTSQNDGEIANMTQASLITADADGVIAYGENYPTVALDYLETYYNAAGAQIGNSNGKGKINGKSDVNGSTVYEFLIKRDMKFSDGVPLTVMDVLFNLYVYLDPIYSGSSTIYSTKIKGLQSYWAQQQVDDDYIGGSSSMQYYADALDRWENLYNWAYDGGANPDEADLSEQGKADLETVKDLYKKELTSDWNSVATGWVESYKEYRFTAAWQVFYYIEGIVHNQTEQNTESGAFENKKDANGKYLTTLDPDWNTEEVVHQDLITEMEAELTAAKVSEYMTKNGVNEEDAKLALSKEKAINHVYSAYSVNSQIDWVLTYTNTGSAVIEEFMRDEMSKDRKEGELDIPRISGITVSHTDDSNHNGKFNGKTYKEDHDILRIEISGIDPKAKWNFGFSVAPLHYYSGTYGGHNYVGEAMNDYTTGKVYDGTATHFGVDYKNADFMNKVIAGDDKSGVPVGAGPYKCTVYNYYSGSPAKLDSKTFFHNSIAYFERNEHFETMGAKIDNAKIKYVTFKVYPDDQIVSALKTGEIDYGTPTATYNNQGELNTGNLKQITYLAGGYGYVGINPKYVPDIEVRQAIMHAFDTSHIIDFYGTDLVNLINRPMSTTSWAYPDNCERYYDRWTNPQQIIDLVESSGNWYHDGSKLRSISGNNVLKLKFTIAGDSTDHPAYQMFTYAKAFLETCGFEISVVTDLQALKSLSTGDLEVWAAAWSSSIDPDPYQIYSIYSNASSTKNWYKDGIMRDPVTFETEYEIAQKLNEKIIEGRNTLDQGDREDIYNKTVGDNKCALDLIMDLAVEFPTYQRYELCVYNSAVLDAKTMHSKDASFNMDPLGELWKVNYKK